jgi:UDP-glucuronate 4-epimerase
MKTVFLTGAAGFIGSKTADLLLKQKYRVVGVDNLNTYYDVRLKNHRLAQLKKRGGFVFHRLDIENPKALAPIFKKYKFDAVVNLAARAGVRYSLIDPHVYFTTNTLGTLNLLELCKTRKIKKFVLASTSSLYAGQTMPFKESLAVNTPISPYAASKKAAELTCYTYNFHYGIDTTIVRYFTVYGPAGRPDMSVFRFIKWIDEGAMLDLFGDGLQSRDFTYIDDIASGTVKAMKPVGFEIINLGGGNKPYTLNYVIHLIEKYLGKKAKIKTFAFPKADIKETWADISKAKKILGWSPTVGLEDGIRRSVDWYLENKRWLKDVKL